jgi:hypothetical protein
MCWFRCEVLTYQFDELECSSVYHIGFPDLTHDAPAGGQDEDCRGYDGQKQLFERQVEIEVDMVHVEQTARYSGGRHGGSHVLCCLQRSLLKDQSRSII